MKLPPNDAGQIKIAIATGNGVGATDHFGYALQFQIWDMSGPQARLLETRRNTPACGADRSEQRRDPLDVSVDLVADCRAVVVAKIGECGINRLNALGILVFETDDTVDAVVRELTGSTLLHGRHAA
ncbi:NifB/NifX family molybdenum-iron cluster-binding protein [Rhodopseudomonas telluris]|uniref:NifB/NifX family molybdenum-iron cluster-binding protein n=1 Tax=Rhodopseudomonas telluris TaxID=644215 RepID=A0ABV6F0B6_9BRAD